MDAETAQRLADLERRLSRVEGREQPGAVKSWTPRIAGTTNAGTYTYVSQIGGYCRIGPYCLLYGQVAISAISATPLGVMVIDQLPFTAANVSGNFASMSFGDISNFNYATNSIGLMGLIQPNEAFIRLLETFDNVVNQSVPAANFTNASCSLIFSGFYRVA